MRKIEEMIDYLNAIGYEITPTQEKSDNEFGMDKNTVKCNDSRQCIHQVLQIKDGGTYKRCPVLSEAYMNDGECAFCKEKENGVCGRIKEYKEPHMNITMLWFAQHFDVITSKKRSKTGESWDYTLTKIAKEFLSSPEKFYRNNKTLIEAFMKENEEEEKNEGTEN